MRDLIAQHNLQWFHDVRLAFTQHPRYNKLTKRLEFEIEEEVDVPIDFDSSGEGIEFVSQPNVRLVQYDLSDYCWYLDKVPGFNENRPALHNTLRAIHETLQNRLTGSVVEKHEKIIAARDEVYDEVSKQQLEKDPSYGRILSGFYKKFRSLLNSEYGDIINFIKAFPNVIESLRYSAQSGETSPSGGALVGSVDLEPKPKSSGPKLKKKKQLKLAFFSDFFNQYDIERYPIISHEDLPRQEEFAKFFYNVYRGVPDNSDITIDFKWEKSYIYYLLTKMKDTSSKFKLSELEKRKCITLRGEPFKSENCSKGPSCQLKFVPFFCF